ncbi:hypothetical protein DRW03_28335 [Corallococcus sp. H22C18031201]|nr:hypothetical protein DRW03_28335 [Corallococcus sp. H22C18031201]
MRLAQVFWPLLCLTACSGPPAPDVAVCQDVITRLCASLSCPGVVETLSVGPADCAGTLRERTGCGTEAFAFVEPSRDRFLDCREPLLRQGTALNQLPACSDVQRALSDCPDMATFFQGATP